MFEEAPSDVIERELDLRSENLFAETEAQLAHLLAIARHAEFNNGDHLYESGTPIANVYLITQGDVELVADGAPSWRFSGSGGIGFLDLMMGRPHARTAIARSDVRTLEIDAADYRDYLQDHSDISQQILSMLCGDLLDDILGTSEPALLLTRKADDAPLDTEEPTLIDRLLILQRVPAFANATVQALANLAQNARVAKLAAGDVIAPAGVRCDTLSILVCGEVELALPDSTLVARRGPIDLVCHVAELSIMPRRMISRATRDSIVLQIDREELLDRLDEHFELVQSVFAYLAAQREAFNDIASASGAISTL